MIIQKNINIQDDKLLNGLMPVLEIINQIEESKDREVTIDFQFTKFVSPLFVLPLMVYLHGSRKQISCVNISSYLSTAHFPGGIIPDDMRSSEFLARMEVYARKNFVPIVNFPASARNDDDKNAILSTVESIIERQLGLTSNIVTGLKYMIGESIDNITEHSESERGYIFAQAYPQKRYLDVCIADTGITLLGSYRKQKDNEIESDLEAIQAANRGISTKNLPNAENRGYGIITSKKMLVEGLGGHYVMLSGKAIHLKSRELDKFLLLPEQIRWEGTIIAFRIPYNNNTFNYVNYLE
jgi:anti-sigma regulatory factor (Ser/Thr protein kinase)